ncbi:hypothetical protein ROLI_024330 [Roseobacter fucihabitans]|uniref:YhdP central domain-containing protein n=1 Tax=Roseobacter fucihabitans TaxID=1537242 RepID=A0ABZ2BU32_9RHOB|nr:AsmA-like C-terminal region-containing protein [Roseobacter litoralis]MBC6965261.1 hypothetical protein [Roseobacter litoralis]
MDPQTSEPRKPRRKKTALAVWMLLALVLAGAGGGLWWVKDRAMVLPDWARAQIDRRLTTLIPDAIVSYGDMMVIVDENWRPRVQVRDVRASTPDGGEIIAFSEVRASLSRKGMLRGKLELRSIDLGGVFLNLRRSAQGAVSLSAGTGSGAVPPPARQAPNLVELITELDELLLRPGLVNLDAANLNALTLRYEDERANRAWTIDGGRLTLERSGDELRLAVDLAVLGGGADVATLVASYAGRIGETASDFGVTFANVDAGDVAVQGPAFGWLRALRAPISGSLRGGMDASGAFEPVSATFQIGAGVIQPTPESSAIPIEGARSYFTYAPATGVLRFDELSLDSKWVSGRLEGSAALADDGQGRIEDLVGQLRLTDLEINPLDFYETPVQVTEAELDFRLTPRPFALHLGRLQIMDQGNRLSASGTVGADENGWDIALDAQLDRFEAPRLMALWPEAVKPKTRNWLSENLFSGTAQDVNAALRWRAGTEPETFLGFDFSGVDVQFLKGMPLIKDAKGHASIIRDRLALIVDQGKVEAPEGGSIDLAGSSFIIPDTKAREDTPGVIRLETDSSVTAALSLLDQPPLEIMRKAGQPVSLAQGHASISGTLALPLEKQVQVEQVNFHLTGEVTSLRSSALVKERVVSAPRLALVASDEVITLRGAGDLDGVPFDVTWEQPLGAPGTPGRVTGQIDISPEALETLKVGLPPEYVRGQGKADVVVVLQKDQPPELDLSSDLRGITLSIPPIGWSKRADAPADFSIVATLSEVPKIQSLILTAPGLTAQGDIVLSGAGALDRVRLSRVRVEDWLDVQVDLVGRGPGVPVGVDLRGGTLDLRRADIPETAAAGDQTPLSVSLDRLQVSDTIAIRDIRGDFTTGSGLDGAFTGTINGGAQVRGRMIPQGTRSAIRLTAEDAGAVLASANLLQQVRGGQFELILTPVGRDGAFDGQLRVLETSVVDAPATAALLNAVSIVGLFNAEGGSSLYFSEVNADFRLTPTRITLREASAVGPSMGISMDGIYALDSGQLQMQGVLTPVYILNGIGSVFTRKGEGLFAFNYSLTGTAKNPEVFVNPLTALTPGGIRDLFRAPRPDVPLEDGETPPPVIERRAPVATHGSDR